ncbi:(E3-independent) E2 ubiquitin-conjugating enzyme [Drosophila kikkawai]|uniref:(E3-independent) E2 ubiquitin-conjugating enzyme n=1 Tax=Drosophila kikkawai TaxID=30033 RepID=A0A6P4JAD4_DROKI|nr:(E3-independent) E2 ubiquitin-conjugating enzyme [Drosophila kikkawai]
MSSHVAGAASDVGGAPELQQQPPPSEEAAAPQPATPNAAHEQAQGQVKTPSSLEARHAGHSRRTGGGQAPSKSQTGNHEYQYFFEDEVFRIDRRGRVHFGVVTETAESYSSDEDDVPDEVLSKGEVRVAFYPDGKEMVQTEQSLGLADRTLMPGDIVRRRMPGQKDLTGQAGYVRDVNVCADVKVLGSKYIIRNVPAERLRPISEWSRELAVCLGTWIGTTVQVDESAVLKSANGARLEITSFDFHKFKDAVGSGTTRDVFNPNVYYRGNLVVGRLPPANRVKNLTPEIALPANRKGRAVYTVESIDTSSITVAWTCRAISQFENAKDIDPLRHPKTVIKGEDLTKVKRLNIYESYMLQIHDRFYLKYSKCDKLVKYTDWEDAQAVKYTSIFNRHHRPDLIGSKLNVSTTPVASSSSNTRNLPKFRRLANKFSGMRTQRPAADQDNDSNANANTSLKASGNSSGIKFRSGRNDDIWETLEDDEDEDEQEPESLPAVSEKLSGEAAEMAASTAAAVSTTSQTPRTTMRYAKRRHMKKKLKSVKKMITSPFVKKEMNPKDGDEIVVETLVVYSTVTVVWQDGVVEVGIHSTQLYPIHHLDDHEFFPGDFVSKANENTTGTTDYGVIQCVDHDERIAKVKWFNIYTNVDNPIPLCKETEELSVYDLKDHSDYQFRPGTMVIRVSNFTGEDVDSTAGQVIDNYPDGRVRVWWAKGHITKCYPQDLFEINHTDPGGYESDASDDSWETQSENSRLGVSENMSSSTDNEELIIGIDRAMEALMQLKKIFRILPERRKPDVLNDLVSVYSNCRYLDHMLKTHFFQEENFKNIIKFTNKCLECSVSEHDEKSSPKSGSDLPETPTNIKPVLYVEGQSTSTPTKRKSSTELEEVQCKKSTDETHEDNLFSFEMTNEYTEQEKDMVPNKLIDQYRSEYAEMLETSRASIAKAFENRGKNDSGVHSRGENTSDDLNNPCSDEKDMGEERLSDRKALCDFTIELIDNQSPDACEVFWRQITDQMMKCRKSLEDSPKLKAKTDTSVIVIFDAEEAATEIADTEMRSVGTETMDEAMEQPLNLNVLSESLPSVDSPMACSSPSLAIVSDPTPLAADDCFQVLPNAPATHHFFGHMVAPANKAYYQRAVQREYRMLQASLPPGVMVRAYEDRMDLMSVMMVGPKRTPYQNALFFFDFQMGRDYPKNPPVCHYISYCTARLNPNLYEEGKVCVSLLGTWSGRDTEVWSPSSTMLQVLVSIQGLILVDEPYYNEAGYEKQRGTQLGNENSRVYNEMAIIKIARSTVKQLTNPPPIFRNELIEHFKEYGGELFGRMQAWSEYSAEAQRQRITSIKDMPEEFKGTCCEMPEFPLLPCSRGFCVVFKGVLAQLQSELAALGAIPAKSEQNGIEAAMAAAAGMGIAPRAAPEEV